MEAGQLRSQSASAAASSSVGNAAVVGSDEFGLPPARVYSFKTAYSKMCQLVALQRDFCVSALLGLSENNDNTASFRYLSWSVSRTFSRRNKEH